VELSHLVLVLASFSLRHLTQGATAGMQDG
jgi:hypothetical protein